MHHALPNKLSFRHIFIPSPAINRSYNHKNPFHIVVMRNSLMECSTADYKLLRNAIQLCSTIDMSSNNYFILYHWVAWYKPNCTAWCWYVIIICHQSITINSIIYCHYIVMYLFTIPDLNCIGPTVSLTSLEPVIITFYILQMILMRIKPLRSELVISTRAQVSWLNNNHTNTPITALTNKQLTISWIKFC